ncbi:MAG: type 4a pilus biogenesis protein PilO [Gammaproteobacteria bacterium]|nr:type 4a pilus biogenesis protein PilO [Gammaproteobacteria bacterium]MBU1653798.1 type 4a pilus biogenesis protein PilO [Gammaproteobacteria bacterium]MBU1961710.1 type 4a pilus biogenesis protein PilO [Gammaproteobacteria bacterium]
MNLQDLNELDVSQIGVWPLPAKLLLILIICLLLMVGGYYFDLETQLNDLTKAEEEERTLRVSLEDKQAKAANLDKYRKQLEDMKQSFGAMLRQLPNKTEVADLLVDVSQTGLAAGLEFNLFQPGAEVPLEFYAELPIKIAVEGGYHEFGEFISGLAALPRIVTIHNIKITPTSKDTGGRLILEATAKTYRYLDEEEHK